MVLSPYRWIGRRITRGYTEVGKLFQFGRYLWTLAISEIWSEKVLVEETGWKIEELVEMKSAGTTCFAADVSVNAS
ncbi:unnamed protein product [Linum trigynum]